MTLKLVDTHTYNASLEKYAYYIDELRRICLATDEPVEGNCFYGHMAMNGPPLSQLHTKQMNLYSAAAEASENIIEIGFNAGHSCLLFLMANPTAKIVCFDICEHTYTVPCFEYLSAIFPGRLTLIKGDSRETLASYRALSKFDMAHIDGAHDKDIADADFKNILPIVKSGGLIVWDDTQDEALNSLCEGYIRAGLVMEETAYPTELYQHRILCKI